MSQNILTLTLLLAIIPAGTSSAPVYTWTDNNGVTHFGDRQPTGSTAERVNVRSGTASDAVADRQNPQTRLQNAQQRQANETELSEETAVQKARRQQRAANCETARSNLDVIDRNARIRVEENGEQRYLSEQEIADKRIEFERIAEENCESSEQ